MQILHIQIHHLVLLLLLIIHNVVHPSKALVVVHLKDLYFLLRMINLIFLSLIALGRRKRGISEVTVAAIHEQLELDCRSAIYLVR